MPSLPRTPPSELLSVATPILAGLLASGHYTDKVDDNGEHNPSFVSEDHGEDWATKGGDMILAKRYSAVAVADAMTLAQELIDLSKLRGDAHG